MTGLILKLPNELLDEIFENGYLSRQDLVNLCKTCQLFRPSAERFLYASLSVASSGQLLVLLRTLVARPDIALRVKAFTYVNDTEQELPAIVSARASILHDALPQLSDLSARMEHRITNSILDLQYRRDSCDQYLPLTIALACMKSLEVLCLECRLPLRHDFKLPLMLAHSANPAIPFSMLSNLHTFQAGRESMADTAIPFELIAPFLSLPRLRRLTSTHTFLSAHKTVAQQCRLLRFRRPLRHVELYGCTWSDEDMNEILNIIDMSEALESFSSEDTLFFDSEAVRSHAVTLLQDYKASLKTLRIIATTFSHLVPSVPRLFQELNIQHLLQLRFLTLPASFLGIDNEDDFEQDYEDPYMGFQKIRDFVLQMPASLQILEVHTIFASTRFYLDGLTLRKTERVFGDFDPYLPNRVQYS